MIEERFNLIDEPWIPITDIGTVSLRQVFSEPGYGTLGGNPIQKIALTKLLLAIAQAACTPEDEKAWGELRAEGLAKSCLIYLGKWHDRFYLYGENPFLQMPAVANLITARTEKRKAKAKNDSERLKAKESGQAKSFGAGFYPDLPSENNTMLSHTLFERTLSNAEKALFIVSIMNFALGGKRVEADLVNFSGQTYGGLYSAKSAPSLGNYVGYLHSFLTGKNLLSTLWLNLLTNEQIRSNKYWENGLGIPPWEVMPKSETCATAGQLKNSYMGCLVAMSRFAFLKDEGIYYLDGIQYPNHSSGWREPSMTINNQGQGIKVLWLNPDKRPWRELTALLSFISATSQSGFDCQQISGGFLRARKYNQEIGIWSGGLKVRGNAGDQSVKQDDDFVESHVSLPSNKEMETSQWFDNLKQEMEALDDQPAKIVYKTTLGFFKSQKMEGKKQAAMASNLFWQLCERKSQDLIYACAIEGAAGTDKRKSLRKNFAQFVRTAYNSYCPNDTARQLDAWAENLPNLGKYLKDAE